MELVSTRNNLYPVFLKLEHLRVLVVGGGHVGLEKISSLLRFAPDACVTLVSPAVLEELRGFVVEHPQFRIEEREFEEQDLEERDLVILATENRQLNEEIRALAKQRGLLCNVADTPDLCDFYLGSIVQKGNLKIAISTNGKSPTIAKRMKEVFNEALPDNIDQVLDNMQTIRNQLKGDFQHKVDKLNQLTQVLVTKETVVRNEAMWKRIATFSLLGFALMIIGYFLFSYLQVPSFAELVQLATDSLDQSFWLFLTAGFLAQLVDGLVGMGYGVTSTTFLMSLGINPAAISSSVHTAEIFSSGISGYSHYKFGNVNKKLFKVLLIPGVLGAIAGAWALVWLGNEYADVIRPALAAYCFILGSRILYQAFKKEKKPKKVKRAGWLAGAGGFLDSFGGGGWGPLVTSTLIAKGRSPQYVIGSVSLSEFFVTLSSAMAFFAFIGITHWQVILGLMLGGAVAAPLSARLAGRLPLRTMLICVGLMVIIWSLRILWKALV